MIRTDTTLDHSQKAEKVCTTRLCVDSSDNLAPRPPVIWGSLARICAQRVAAAPGGTEGAAFSVSAPPQLSWQSMRSVSVWSWVRRRGLAARARRGLQDSAANALACFVGNGRSETMAPSAFSATRTASVSAWWRARTSLQNIVQAAALAERWAKAP